MNSKIITSANNKGTGQHPYSLFITSSFDSMISNAKFQAPELVSDRDNSFSLDTFEQVQV